jgi:hypothetical protein
MKQPIVQHKKKEINVRILIDDINDLKQGLIQLNEQLQNGTQVNEFHFQTCAITFEIDFIEKSDFIEKQIDGVWFRVYKSKID